MSDDFMNAVRDFADREYGGKMRALYEDAILAMIGRIDGGEKVIFPAVIAGRGWNARHIRLSPEVFELMTKRCGELRVHKSIFFHRAVRDYLSSKGVDTPE
jgi:hypothetical protein